MSGRILKFDLASIENEVPVGKVLAVAFQDGRLRVWLLAHAGTETMRLRVCGTGEEGDWHDHVGTAVSNEFVFHVFREGQP